MSLINQALRKAQRDRNPSRIGSAGDHPPGGGPGGFAGSAAPRPGGFNIKFLIGLVFAFALLIGLLAGLTIVLLNQSPSAKSPQQASAPPASSPTAPEPPPEPAAPGPTAPVITPAPQTSAQAPTPSTTDTPSPAIVEELRLAREAAEAKAAADAEAARQAEAEALAAKEEAEAEAKARAEIQPSQEIIQWLAESRITGVRLSGGNSKVILNGKAYGIDETVNHALGLSVLAIQEKRVLFVDENGTKYMKAR